MNIDTYGKYTLNYIFFSNSEEIYLLTGILLAATLFVLIIFVGLKKNRSYLLFSSYSLSGALSLLSFTQDQIFLFVTLFTISCIFLLYFFLTFFDNLQSKIQALAPLLLIVLPLAGILFLDDKTETTFLITSWTTQAATLMVCSLIALRAYNKQQSGGQLLFFASALTFFLEIVLISDAFFVSSLSIASIALIFAVSYAILQDIRKQNELLQQLKTKALHLENEMLKKSIQPHFLINTLTVLSEWIEEQPALAVQQINLLSKEFRFISRVSDQKVISIREELEGCQVHLDMFNKRRSSNFVLETKNIALGTPIPPMIFHTLIENGLTHSNSEEGYFVIEQEETQKDTKFRISVEPIVESEDQNEGLGLAYIKSRLQQTFPDKWCLSSEARNNAWETQIIILR